VVIARDLTAANARDLAVNTWFWNMGEAHPWLHDLAKAISWFADGQRNIITVPIVVIALVIMRKWRWALFLIVSSQAGLLISNLLKFSVSRERPPFLATDGIQQHLSFPSGHTFSGFTVWCAMALIAWFLLPRRAAVPVAVVLAAVGLLQAPARLIVGKHWVTDVLGSWLIGSGWLLLVWAGFLWWLAPRPGR
jgi:undecaprenyl-diphosphatase